MVHVGLMRTALFNWAHARHTGGTFVFRIEDTDAARDSEESYRHLLDCLRWLGLDWDEGPEVGGPHGPYRQSERHDVYRDVAAKLLAAGHAYESFSTNEEVDARRLAAGQDRKLGYDNDDRYLTDAQKAAFRDEGRQPVLRLRMPDEDLVWTDLVRGEIRFTAGSVPDFVLVRGNGAPLYPFVNPVDDALMTITDVLRGEDLLPSTPRQLALYAALTDIGSPRAPRGSATCPTSPARATRSCPSGTRSPTSTSTATAGSSPRVSGTTWPCWAGRSPRTGTSSRWPRWSRPSTSRGSAPTRRASTSRRPRRSTPPTCARSPSTSSSSGSCRTWPTAGLIADPPTPEQDRVLRAVAPLAQERMIVLSEAVGLLGFLFVEDVDIDPAAGEKQLSGADAVEVLDAATAALRDLPDFTTPAIEEALKTALVEGLGRKPRQAFGPVRVAVSGRTVSPPLYESIELLGRERTLARLAAARTWAG